MKISGTYDLIGVVPENLRRSLVLAVESVPPRCFFDQDGSPLSNEIKELDAGIAKNLKEQGYTVETDWCPFSDNKFNVDLAIPERKLLVEIEKGKLPRLELDILKVASACFQFPTNWRYGALVVPDSFIKLPLEGRQTPFMYLKRLKPLIQPLFNELLDRDEALVPMKGFVVVGYWDPRAT